VKAGGVNMVGMGKKWLNFGVDPDLDVDLGRVFDFR